MTDRLMLDYVASRDRVPDFARGTPWFNSAKAPGDVDAKLGKMAWRAGAFTGGTVDPAILPRPPGFDPRFTGLGSETCPNRDAMDLLGGSPFGYDAGAQALTMSARPLTRAEHAKLGRPLGVTSLGPYMHTSHWGFGYGRWEVVCRTSGEVGAFGAPLWGIFFGANSDPTMGNGYAEIDLLEYLGHKRKSAWQTIHFAEYKFNADGTIQRSAAGAPLHQGTIQTGKEVLLDFDMSTDFHTYGLDWDADRIRWDVDGVTTFEVPTPKAFRGKRFVLISNLAVGSSPAWARAPDASTEWPMVQAIRSIRAWERG